MRQFVSQVNPDKKGLIEVSGKDYRYFKQVLRLAAGDMLAVRIPEGSLVNTTVARVDEARKTVTLQLCDVQNLENGENQSDYTLDTSFYLFQFVAKGPKMDLIVRQATECGIREIIPVTGDYSQAGGSEKNLRSERFSRIIKEARQQSGSPVSTKINETLSLKEACAEWKTLIKGKEKESFAFVLYERNDKTTNLFNALENFDEIKNCAVFCGAEGGISPEEIDYLISEGVIPVHLETNILRCETAALYGMACVQNAVAGRKIWQKK